MPTSRFHCLSASCADLSYYLKSPTWKRKPSSTQSLYPTLLNTLLYFSRQQLYFSYREQACIYYKKSGAEVWTIKFEMNFESACTAPSNQRTSPPWLFQCTDSERVQRIKRCSETISINRHRGKELVGKSQFYKQNMSGRVVEHIKEYRTLTNCLGNRFVRVFLVFNCYFVVS